MGFSQMTTLWCSGATSIDPCFFAMENLNQMSHSKWVPLQAETWIEITETSVTRELRLGLYFIFTKENKPNLNKSNPDTSQFILVECRHCDSLQPFLLCG